MTSEGLRPATAQEGVTLAYASQACGKQVCEDFFDMACPAAPDLEARGLVFALADGMSGGAGRRAAETCVRSVLSDFYATPSAWDVARGLDRIIGSVNGWLLAHNLRSGEAECMLSTLSVLVLHADRFHVGHVGDSRIYRVRDRQCECLTTDHVWPRADMRHVLRRAVGLDHHLVVDCFSDALAPGDRFVMLSDGVWEVLGEAGLRETLSASAEAQSLATTLVQRSAERQRGYYGRNDATAAIVEVRSLPAATSE